MKFKGPVVIENIKKVKHLVFDISKIGINCETDLEDSERYIEQIEGIVGDIVKIYKPASKMLYVFVTDKHYNLIWERQQTV